MMKFGKFVIVLTLLFSTSTIIVAQSDTEVNAEVRAVNTKMMVDGYQMFYALPKNVIRVGVEMKITQNYKGPYALYAQKYLNITEGLIMDDGKYYDIADVSFDRYSLVDSSRYFSIIHNFNSNFTDLQLNEDGVILACNHPLEIKGYTLNNCQMIHPEVILDDFFFSDLGIKPFIEESSKTLYKTVQTEESTKRVPYKQNSYVQTTEEENAFEAAAYIRKLRKRKLKLLTGMQDEVNAYDGIAIKNMIENLERLENQYIELFTGKAITTTQKFYFDFEPTEDVGAEQKILCWFSPTLGIQSSKPDIRKSDFEPVLLKATPIGNIPKPKIQVMDNTQKTPTSIKYGLFYRIPGRVDITLQMIDKVLAKQQIQIAQKGEVIPLPVEYLDGEKFSIEFHPETGALKQVKSKPLPKNDED